jgi:hypothetical protein
MSRTAVLLVLVLGAIAVGEGFALWRMDARISKLELTAPREADRPRATAGPALASGEAAVAPEEMRSVLARMTVLERHREAVLARVPDLEGPAAGDSETARLLAAAEGRGSLGARLEEALDRRIDERLRERDEAAAKGGEGEKEDPSISELSEAVAMTDDQEDAVVRSIDAGKRRVFDLLAIPREDGRSMVDDLRDALQADGDPGEAMQKWFFGLMKERIPGRQETYLTEILKIQRTTWDGIGRTLDEKQLEKLRRTGVDILEVKTGFDPFAEALERDG